MDLNCDGPEPNPDIYDSHMSNVTPQAPINPVLKPNASDLYKNSLVYLFDFDKKTKNFYKKPRQILPVAVFLMKNKISPPPTSQILRKSITCFTQPTASSSSTASCSTASESCAASTSLLIESTEINYCKKSLLITTPVEKELNRKKTIEVETQTVTIEVDDACVQTETEEVLIEEEVEVEEEEDVVESENKKNETLTQDEIIKIECDIYVDDDQLVNFNNQEDEQEINDYFFTDNDDCAASPLPSLRSPTPQPLAEIEQPKAEEAKTNSRLKRITKKQEKLRILIRLARKLIRRAIRSKKKAAKSSTKEQDELYSNISTTPTVSSNSGNQSQEIKLIEEEKENSAKCETKSKESSTKTTTSTSNSHIKCLLSIKLPPIDRKTLNIYWNSLYFAFIFLSKGSLVIKDALRELRVLDEFPRNSFAECKQIQQKILSIKFLENPCDPTDVNKSFMWKYTSSKHYKILKLKHTLVSRLKWIHGVYKNEHAQLLKKKSNNSNIVDYIKEDCLNRLNTYIGKWMNVTTDLIEIFKKERESVDINDEKELNKFVENSYSLHRTLYKRENNVEIDSCSLKFYLLSELLMLPINPIKASQEEFCLYKHRLNDSTINSVLSRPAVNEDCNNGDGYYRRGKRKKSYDNNNNKKNSKKPRYSDKNDSSRSTRIYE